MERKPDTTATPLITPDDVESLVGQRRIPQRFMKAWGAGKKPDLLVAVPLGPEENSNFALHTLPLKVGREVQRKVWETLRAQGLDNSGDLSFFFRKLGVWLSDNLDNKTCALFWDELRRG